MIRKVFEFINLIISVAIVGIIIVIYLIVDTIQEGVKRCVNLRRI